MKSFKNIFLLSLIIDFISFLPIFLVYNGGEMRDMMIESMGIEGLAQSTEGMAVMDTMVFVFGFIGAGYIASLLYALRLKNLSALKAAAFILGIVHLAWTLPDFVNFAKGSAGHPPLVFMILSLVPIAGLFYVSKNGEIKSY